MENKILVADFSGARKFDDVRDVLGNEGCVSVIEDHYLCIVCQKLGTKYKVNFKGYLLDSEGNFDSNFDRPVWFYDFPDQFPKEEHCKRPLPEIEVDEKILVWDGSIKDFINVYATGKFTDHGGIETFVDGSTEWSNKSNAGVGYTYWKLASDPTINSGNLQEIKG